MKKFFNISSLAAIVPCGEAGNPCTVCHFFVLISNIVNFLTKDIVVPVAVVVLLYGGFMLLTSGGDEGKLTKGKNALWMAVWGIIIAFAAWIIVDTILKVLITGGLAGGTAEIKGWGPWNKLNCN